MLDSVRLISSSPLFFLLFLYKQTRIKSFLSYHLSKLPRPDIVLSREKFSPARSFLYHSKRIIHALPCLLCVNAAPNLRDNPISLRTLVLPRVVLRPTFKPGSTRRSFTSHSFTDALSTHHAQDTPTDTFLPEPLPVHCITPASLPGEELRCDVAGCPEIFHHSSIQFHFSPSWISSMVNVKLCNQDKATSLSRWDVLLPIQIGIVEDFRFSLQKVRIDITVWSVLQTSPTPRFLYKGVAHIPVRAVYWNLQDHSTYAASSPCKTINPQHILPFPFTSSPSCIVPSPFRELRVDGRVL